MFTKKNQFIVTLTGTQPGPKTIIQGCTHGNERGGKDILEKLVAEISPDNLSGQLGLILGNPQAYEKNVRFIDEDLNRLLEPEKLKSILNLPPKTGGTQGAGKEILNQVQDDISYEQKRLLEIIPHYQNIDYLLDIHATINPSVPFVYCEDTKKHKNLAQIFDTQYIISPERNFNSLGLRACFDNYADRLGAIGLTYEAGQIGAEEDVNSVYQKVIQFLEETQNLPKKHNQKPKTKNQKFLTLFAHLWTTTDNFQFAKPPKNFQPFTKNNLIAADGSILIRAPDDCCLIFPKIEPKQNTLAGYLAHHKI